MKTVFSYLAAYKGRISVGLLLKTGGTVAELLLPLIMAHMIDDIAPQGNIPILSLWGVGMLLCAVAALVGNVAANRMASRVARDTTERLRKDLFSKSLNLSARQIDEVTLPSLVSRLSSDTYNVHNMVGMMQRLGVRAPILLIGGVALTFTVDPVLALVLLISVPFLTLIVFFVSKKGIDLYTKLQRSVDGMVRKVRDDHAGIRVIKALSKSEYESASFRKINDAVVENETKAGVMMGVTNPLMNVVLNLGMTAVLFAGAYRVAAGRAMVGELIAFTSFFTIILNAVISVSRIFVNFSKGGASAKRIGAILRMPEDLLPVPAAVGACGGGYIRFENVCFSYGGVPALENISFSVDKGQSLGIIGATGSGKSTLLSLLMRFYDPDSGTITIAGKDVRSYEHRDLCQKFGAVFQSDFLMAASVRDNIDFERELPQEQIERAAEFAQADEFIAGHGGYGALLTARGANFSGGQKQRLLIARALASSPEILVLDDSSSALDYRTDAELRKTLLKNLPNSTVILIAQRISSVRFADRILVLENGKVAGFGSDEELMQTCETYRRIYASQHEEEIVPQAEGGDVFADQ